MQGKNAPQQNIFCFAKRASVLPVRRGLPRLSMFSFIVMKPIGDQRRHMQSESFPWVIS